MSDPPGRDDRRPPRAEVGTRLLRAREQGEPGSEEKLFLLVYDELREIAGAFLRRERPDHTLQPTALVHEAWMRLVDAESVGWQGRAHFFGTASRAMRRILVEHARGKERLKRGGAWRRVDLDPDLMQGGEEVDLDALDRALEKLAALSERPARVVELRFFSGLPVETVAEVLGVSARTVEREWRFARAWLAEALGEPGG